LRHYIVPVLQRAKAGFADSGIACIIEERFDSFNAWPHVLFWCTKILNHSDDVAGNQGREPRSALGRGLAALGQKPQRGEPVGFLSLGKTVTVYVAAAETPSYRKEILGTVDVQESEGLVSKAIEHALNSFFEHQKRFK